MSDPGEDDILEMDIAVARAALKKARHLIEVNADCDEPQDAATLRQVFSLILDASSGVAGAAAVITMRNQMRGAIAEKADRRVPWLKIVK